MCEFPASRWMLSCLLSPLLRSSLLSVPIPEPISFMLKLQTQRASALDVGSLSDLRYCRRSEKLVYLFIKGNVPSLLRLWFAAGVLRFAGSENMILNMVHVVETWASTTSRGVRWNTDVLGGHVKVYCDHIALPVPLQISQGCCCF